MLINQKILSSKLTMFFVVGTGILLLFSLGVSLLYVYFGLVEFDEGFNLQIPSSLVRNGTYSTTYDGGKVFDPVISTGPTVLLPIAGIFALFGIGLAQARIVMLIYFMIFILLIVAFTYRRFGIVSAFFVLVCLLLLPDIFYFGLKVFGEIPSLMFLLLGLIFLEDDHAIASGIFFGLALITKTIYIIVVIPLFVLFLFETLIGRELKTSLKSFGRLVLGILIPNFLLEITKLYSLGVDGYKENMRGILLLSNGAAQLPGSLFSLVTPDRLEMFSFPFPGIPIWIILFLIFSVFFYNLLIIWRQRQGYFNAAGLRTRLSLVLFVCFYFFWWIFGSETGWWRHLFPGYLMFMVLVGISLGEIAAFLFPTNYIFQDNDRWLSWAKTSAIIIVACLAFAIFILFPMTSQARKIWQSITSDTLYNQIHVAQNVNRIVQGSGHIGYWGWWQSPEISFLAQTQFHNIEDKDTRNRFDSFAASGDPTYILISPAQRILVPKTLHDEMIYLGDLINEVGDFQIYQYTPTFDTAAQNYYILQRENIADIPTKFCPIDLSQNKLAKRYIYDGVYSDGWIGKKASFWLNNEKGFDEIVIAGTADFQYYSEDRLTIRVNLNDVQILVTEIESEGEFKFNTPIPRGITQTPLVKAAIEVSRSFVPREMGINNDDRELSIQVKCIELK